MALPLARPAREKETLYQLLRRWNPVLGRFWNSCGYHGLENLHVLLLLLACLRSAICLLLLLLLACLRSAPPSRASRPFRRTKRTPTKADPRPAHRTQPQRKEHQIRRSNALEYAGCTTILQGGSERANPTRPRYACCCCLLACDLICLLLLLACLRYACCCCLLACDPTHKTHADKGRPETRAQNATTAERAPN